ncbi:MAG: alpha/beta hydrolase [Chloroflexi bacterium]|uniref:alpha/beta fold hydrolase n=1 Tax=Candidatus Flexifilum breve TaxID=3140694 RepID=UPI003134A320|nr:alpha/beta hydrolase [Chloroflexota bacterium]
MTHTHTLEHKMISTNGVNLHVVQAGDPNGELVILLHGFPEFWYGWRQQIDYLAAAGYWVWAPDQRGYNLSEKPRGIEKYKISTLAADVAGLIDAAGREQAYVVGHDWGAAVAWMTAIRHAERVKKLAILNVPHPKIMLETVRSSPAQMLKSWYIGFFQLPVLPELFSSAGEFYFSAQALLQTSKPGTFSDADITEYIRAWKQPGALSSMINWYRAMGRRLDDGAFLNNARVTVPTIIIWGAQDRFLQREMAQESTTLCDDARVIYFEDATHWVQHEKPNEVNALLSEFFS